MHLLQREASSKRYEDNTCLCLQRKTDCCQGLCWFSKVVVVTSLISMTSLTLNTWLSFQYHALFSFSFVGLKSSLRVIDYYWGVYATTELLVTMSCLSEKKPNLRAIGYYWGMYTNHYWTLSYHAMLVSDTVHRHHSCVGLLITFILWKLVMLTFVTRKASPQEASIQVSSTSGISGPCFSSTLCL